MVRLIKNEYFTNKNNSTLKITQQTATTGIMKTAVNRNNAANRNNRNAANRNNRNNNAENQNNEFKISNIGKKVFNLIIPDNLNITTSDINNMVTTPATIENGKVVVQSTTSVSNKEENSKENRNNSIFTTQTKINKDDSAPDLTTQVVKNEIDYEYQSMFNKVRNFLKYPDEQKFCPNIDNSESSFWVHLPEKYAGDHLCKFCCTSCYTVISKRNIFGRK